MQQELESTKFEFTAGGGAVKATIVGTRELQSIEIDPEVVDPEDVEMLQDMILAAVNGDPNILKFVTNPELLKAAVRSDWKIVKKIDNASDELWAEAVRVNVDALKFVRHPGEAVLMAAVERDWTYLQEIEHPTAAIVVAAVKQDYRAFEYVSIKNRTEAVQLAAVRTDPRCIQYLQRASERVQMEAVRNNKDVFHLIKNPAEAVKEFCK